MLEWIALQKVISITQYQSGLENYTMEHGTTRVRHETTRVQHDTTRNNTSETRVQHKTPRENMRQHEYNTRQHEYKTIQHKCNTTQHEYKGSSGNKNRALLGTFYYRTMHFLNFF